MLGFPPQILVLLQRVGCKVDAEAMHILCKLPEESHGPVFPTTPWEKTNKQTKQTQHFLSVIKLLLGKLV